MRFGFFPLVSASVAVTDAERVRPIALFVYVLRSENGNAFDDGNQSRLRSYQHFLLGYPFA